MVSSPRRFVHDLIARFKKRKKSNSTTASARNPRLPSRTAEDDTPSYGFIEGTNDEAEIVGWVRPDKKYAFVVVYFEGEEIARAAIDQWRKPDKDHTGFKVATSLACEDLNLLLLQGRVWANVEDQSGAHRLDLEKPFHSSLLLEYISEELKNVTAEDLRRILGRIQHQALFADEDFITSRLQEEGAKGEMTEVLMPVGLTSFDDVAIVGREGYVFLQSGSNTVREQYQKSKNDPNIVEKTDNWVNVLTSRSDIIRQTSPYLQLVIPEKSSLLNDLFPANIGNSTTLMKSINARISSDAALSSNYIDAAQVLNRIRDKAFLKLDTHLTALGTYEIVSEILRRAGLATLDDVEFGDTMQIAGDIGRRLVSPHATEPMLIPTDRRLEALEKNIKLIYRGALTPGAHVGTHIITVNSGALHKIKVFAFGDSNCNYGTAPNQLSWWFSRIFSDFHFRWLPYVEHDYIKEHKPDLVICQTIERFLVHVPER